MQDQIRSNDAEKYKQILTSRRKVEFLFDGQFSGIYHSLRRAGFESREIYAAQIRNEWNCRASCTTSESRNFVSTGSVRTTRKLVGRNNGVYCNLRSLTDLQADSQTPCEPRFNSPVEGAIIPFGGEVKFCQGQVRQFGKRTFPGVFIRYALNAERSWTGDLLIVDTYYQHNATV